MLRLQELAVPLAETAAGRREALEKKIQTLFAGRLPEYTVRRRSLDARHKGALLWRYSVDVRLENPAAEARWLKKHAAVHAETVQPVSYAPPPPGTEPLKGRPIVVGAGPAGLFAAYLLAREGYRPLLIEQGAPVEERQMDVRRYWAGGALSPFSNVQFGEGGAGTFSDGKLATGIKDVSGRIPFVLRTFADCGGGEELTFDAKPHIGTDVLATVVRNLRDKICALGGEVRFHTQLESVEISAGKLTRIHLKGLLDGARESVADPLLILAPGHSARALFEELAARGVPMEAKPFAVGVRIQHPQSQINALQYGAGAPAWLPAADYKLTAQTAAGRGVYSFCMCPGGTVVDASSEPGRICVNGMSLSARAGANANAALIVGITPEDYRSGAAPSNLDGVHFQRALEEAAFRAGEGRIPVQQLGDFAAGKATKALGDVTADIAGRWAFGKLSDAMPGFLKASLLEAMPQFDRKMPGFARPDALLAGFEARSSSPLRILRDEHLESPVRGLFPCGEGAGYAGGITSAAVDGLKTAEEIIRRWAPC